MEALEEEEDTEKSNSTKGLISKETDLMSLKMEMQTTEGGAMQSSAEAAAQSVVPLLTELLNKLEQRLVQEMQSIKLLMNGKDACKPEVSNGGTSGLWERSSCESSIATPSRMRPSSDWCSTHSDASSRHSRMLPGAANRDVQTPVQRAAPQGPSSPRTPKETKTLGLPGRANLLKRFSMISTPAAPLGKAPSLGMGQRMSVVSVLKEHKSLRRLQKHMDEVSMLSPKTRDPERERQRELSMESGFSATSPFFVMSSACDEPPPRLQRKISENNFSELRQISENSNAVPRSWDGLDSGKTEQTVDDVLYHSDSQAVHHGPTSSSASNASKFNVRQYLWKRSVNHSTTAIFDGSNRLDSMRKSRHDQVLQLAGTSVDTFTASVCAPTWLYVVGILPCSAMFKGSAGLIPMCCRNLNRLLVLLLLIGAVVFYIFKLSSESGLSCDVVICLEELVSPLLIISCGCFMRLLSFPFDEDVVGYAKAPLTNHIISIGNAYLWKLHTQVDMAKVLLCWLSMVAAGIYNSFHWNVDAWEAIIYVVFFAFTTHVFMALAYSMVHICRGLFLSIDSFCMQVIEEGNFDNAMQKWRTLDAVLRTACITVARSFLMLLTSALAAIFIPVAMNKRWETMLPGAIALLVVLWVSFFIGGITSNCDRVPAFLNLLDFGDEFDERRQYVVDYVINSRAGCYMFEVRVTGEMVVKCAYVGCVVAVGFATTLLSS